MHAIMNKMLKFQDVNQKVKKSPKAEQYVIFKTRHKLSSINMKALCILWSGVMDWSLGLEWSIGVDTWSGTLELYFVCETDNSILVRNLSRGEPMPSQNV